MTEHFEVTMGTLSRSVDHLAVQVAETSKHVADLATVMQEGFQAMSQHIDQRIAESEHRMQDFVDRRIEQSETRLERKIGTLVDVLERKEVISPQDARKVISA